MISTLSRADFQFLLLKFDKKYVDDWDNWLNYCCDNDLEYDCYLFGKILRKWQAARPNSMRRCSNEANHSAPYLEDLIEEASGSIQLLSDFDISKVNPREIKDILHKLWNIFLNLTYKGRGHQGKASVVGISKAVLLLTKGRVGPAFDKRVKSALKISDIKNSSEWVYALEKAFVDIQRFQNNNKCSIYEAAGKYNYLHAGRIYDMAMWSLDR